jgi:DNA-binding NarL/FixJ family response regulator
VLNEVRVEQEPHERRYEDGPSSPITTKMPSASGSASINSARRASASSRVSNQSAQLAADGLSNREIGERLYLSHRTVESHLYRLFPKLGVTSRAQLRDALSPGADS